VIVTVVVVVAVVVAVVLAVVVAVIVVLLVVLVVPVIVVVVVAVFSTITCALNYLKCILVSQEICLKHRASAGSHKKKDTLLWTMSTIILDQKDKKLDLDK
jgi:hypothetical protein